MLFSRDHIIVSRAHGVGVKILLIMSMYTLEIILYILMMLLF